MSEVSFRLFNNKIIIILDFVVLIKCKGIQQNMALFVLQKYSK